MIKCRYCRGAHERASQVRSCAEAAGVIADKQSSRLQPPAQDQRIAEASAPARRATEQATPPPRAKIQVNNPRRRKKRAQRDRSGSSTGRTWTPGFEPSKQSQMPGGSGKPASNPDLVKRISDGLPQPIRHERLHPTSRDGVPYIRESRDAEQLRRMGNLNDHDG